MHYSFHSVVYFAFGFCLFFVVLQNKIYYTIPAGGILFHIHFLCVNYRYLSGGLDEGSGGRDH